MTLLQSQGKRGEAIDLLAPVEAAMRTVFTGDNVRRLGDMLGTLGRTRFDLGYEPDRFSLAESTRSAGRTVTWWPRDSNRLTR